MKTTFAVFGVLAHFLAQGQGTVYSSNLDNTPTGSFALASDSWIGQEFAVIGRTVNGVLLTPPSTLNAVQLKMDAASGNPSGLTVSLYTRGNGPGTFLGVLSGDSDPRTPGVYTYTADGITLPAAAGYLVVVTSESSAAEGAYNWSTAFTPSQSSNGNLAIGYYFDSTDGVSWSSHIRQDVGLMAVYATPVPEPSSCLVFVYGAVCLVYARRHYANRTRRR